MIAGTTGRGRLATDVGRRLADEIVLGRFAPGARLDETMLARRFGVSRTPVREALKQLVVTGLVTTRPNHGSVVAAMTPAQLDDMFEAIGELEAACARHAALRMNDADRAALNDIHVQAREAMRSDDAPLYDALNRRLHQAILHGSHNTVLVDMATLLQQRVAPFRSTQFRSRARIAESFAEHSAIAEAILTGDSQAAHRAMRHHLQSTRSAAGRLAPAWSSPPIPSPSFPEKP